jgi:hypothetical protein
MKKRKIYAKGIREIEKTLDGNPAGLLRRCDTLFYPVSPSPKPVESSLGSYE